MAALSMDRVSRLWVLSLAAWSILGVAATPRAAREQSAQQPPGAADSSRITVRKPDIHVAPFQVDVNMVVVSVTVTDPYDRIVTRPRGGQLPGL